MINATINKIDFPVVVWTSCKNSSSSFHVWSNTPLSGRGIRVVSDGYVVTQKALDGLKAQYLVVNTMLFTSEKFAISRIYALAEKR